MSADDIQLTPELKEEFKEAFSLFDKDNDGIINIKELPFVMKSLGQDLSPKECQEIDEDGSGGVDFDEFLEVMIGLMKKTKDETEFRQVFKLFDTDKDGFLSATDLRFVMAHLGEKIADEEAEAMIAEANTAKRGKMDYNEFYLMMTDPQYD